MTSKREARIERRKSRAASLMNLTDKPKDVEDKSDETGEPSQKRVKISDEEYQSIKILLREKKRAILNAPLFRLVQVGLSASLNLPKESRAPVLATDVQTLLLFPIIGDSACFQFYKWCNLARWNNLSQTLVLIVDNVSVDDLESNKDIFTETCKIFEDGVEMNNPKNDGYSLDLALAYVPISNGMKKRVLAGYSSLQAASENGCIYGIDENVDKRGSTAKVENGEAENSVKENLESSDTKIVCETQVLSFNSPKNEATKSPDESVVREALTNRIESAETDIASTSSTVAIKKDDKTVIESSGTTVKNGEIVTESQNGIPGCSRLKLLLSASQLIKEEYPIPGNEEFKHFVLTQDKYEPVTDQSPMFSVDCEWCTCIDGSYGLARVAIVDENLKPIYQTLVKPDLEIVNYLTRYSGITEELLKDVTKTLSDVQQDIRKLLPPDAILVGQSLQSDLKALKLLHPYVIDTSVIYNLTGRRSFKSKLKVLVASFCGRSIQDSLSGHDPTEDAIGAMELVLLKLKMGIKFGDVILSGRCEGLGETRERNRFRDRDDVFVDPDSSIHMKFFTFIQSHNQGATLITTHPSVETSYRPRLKKLKEEMVKNKKKNEPLADPVQIVEAKDFQDAVQATIQSRLNQSFTLVHTSLEGEEENRKKYLKELDQAIADIYNGISLNGMMVVVFGGRTSPLQNGACLVRVNNKSRIS